VSVRLAADPARSGPPALTWLRRSALASLPGWPGERDPFGELTLQLSARGVRFDGAALGELGDSYLCATIDVPGAGRLSVRGDFAGLEEWRCEDLSPSRGRLGELLDVLGLVRHRGPLLLDVGALVGGWLPGLDHADPLAPLLGMGPAECGELTLSIERQGNAWRALGRSRGGMLLPAVLWVLADLRARPESRNGARRQVAPSERWVWLARCARDGEREEAARQLVLCAGALADDTLERLLLADDFTRAVAMDALVRRGAAGSLERVVHAATPAIDGTEALAEVALQSLLPLASRDRRTRILDALPEHESAVLRDFARRHGGEPAAPDAPAAKKWLALTALLASAAALSLWLAVRAVQRRVAW
jgi:hypothetical protein